MIRGPECVASLTSGMTPLCWSGCVRVLRPRLWAGRLGRIIATRKRRSREQIVRKLMTADGLLAKGKDVAAVCRELAVSEATYHRWRNQFRA